MVDKKISDYSAASALAGTDLIEVVQSGDNFKTTPANIATYVASTASAVTDLTSASALDGTETMALVQGGNSRKTLISTIATYLQGLTGLNFTNAVRFATMEIGNASDTTVSRASAGKLAVEGVTLLDTTNVSDTTYASSWDGVTTISPSKNAVYDKIEAFHFPAPVTNNWYSFSLPGTSPAGANLQTANRVFYQVIWVPRTITINSLGVSVTTSGGANNFGLAIYALGATNRPTGTPLAKTGDLSYNTTGFVSATITGGNVTLAPGFYAAAFWNGASTTGAVQGMPGSQTSLLAWALGDASSSNIRSNTNVGYSSAGFWGTSHTYDTSNWPDVSGDSWTPNPGDFNTCAIVYWKSA